MTPMQRLIQKIGIRIFMSETIKFNEGLQNLHQEKLEELKKLLPNLFDKDGNLIASELENFVKSYANEKQEPFVFSWAGKQKAKAMAFKQSETKLALKFDEKRSKNFDKTENLIIEGDNLHVLKLLLPSYKGKIKCIYIDPPYNTQNDFIYPDNFAESEKEYLLNSGQVDLDGDIIINDRLETQGRKHSVWLSMMYPRLILAHELLREDGVIFVSIDDNEVHHLRQLMNEVFREENLAGQITISGNPRGRDYGGIARMHDYLIVYTKSEEAIINNLSDDNKEFPYHDDKGGFEIRELRNRNIAFNIKNRPNLHYPFYINPNSTDENGFYEISLDKKDNWIELFPKESQGVKTVWRWGKERSKEFLNIDIVAKRMQEGGWQVVDKYRGTTRMARSIWNDKDVNTEKGTLAIKELLNGKYFDFPKPVEMIKRIIEMGANPNDIILDFFAGSGTTAQAVMELNQEEIDKKSKEGLLANEEKEVGSRKFILVQLPEKIDTKKEAFKAGYEKISEITIERVRRAGEKYKSVDAGFKVMSVTESAINRKFMNSIQATSEEIFAEIALSYGYGLNFEVSKLLDGVWKLSGNNRNAVIILENEQLSSETQKQIIMLSDKLKDCQIFAQDACLNVEIIHNFYQHFEQRRVVIL